MNQNPVVSVCIACFNASKTIENTISSVLNQTYTELEIIITDNQSIDHTVELVRAIQDSRIHVYVNDTNVGMSKNFEIAVSKASGKYVKLLCADDLMTPDCIEKELRIFMQNPNSNIAAVTSEKWIIDEKDQKLFVKRFPGKAGLKNGIKAVRKTLRYGGNIFGEPGCILYSKEALDQAGAIAIRNDLTYVFDLSLTCNTLLHGNLYVIKEPLFLFRVSTFSFTANSLWKSAKVINRFITKIKEEKLIPLSFFDIAMGRVMAWVMCIARNMVFFVVNKLRK